jgi:uncharacterized protein
MKKLLVIFLIQFFAFNSANADTYDDAVKEYEQKNYAVALDKFKQSANENNSWAQSMVAFMYSNGQGVAVNYEEAYKWNLRSAEMGNPAGQFNLALALEDGQGVKQNFALALKYYRMAAEQNILSAQTNLGLMYAKGRGVSQNKILAYMWFNLGAREGNDLAIKNRDILVSQLTQAQIIEGQRLATECEKQKYKDCAGN